MPCFGYLLKASFNANLPRLGMLHHNCQQALVESVNVSLLLSGFTYPLSYCLHESYLNLPKREKKEKKSMDIPCVNGSF